MKTAHQARLRIQEELGVFPRYGNLLGISRARFEQLAQLPADAPWPPTGATGAAEPITMAARRSRIILEASRYVGLTETVGNRKWDLLATPGKDPIADELVRILTAAGWQPGWPYCAAFVEAIWRAAYADVPALAAQIAAVLNPHCLTSYRHAEAKGWTSRDATVGSIGIMQKGDTDQGHAFIVQKPAANGWLSTIEANTSPKPGSAEADRNGDGIYRKDRILAFARTTGLHIIGFIQPPSVSA